jgi:bifunctional UDP-N-acetylglucosamine pyrophosphorylase/glucosamine-1-phosphate N-acetyltransferase
MRSSLPKVLHPLLGRPLIYYSIDTALGVTGSKPVVVIGHGAAEIRQALGETVDFVLQEPQLGTGHAVQQAEPLLRSQSDLVLVTYADMPLLTEDTLAGLVESQKGYHGPFTMLTVISEDPRGFGRVARNPDGTVSAIIEEAQADAEQLQIRELNVGAYCFKASWLWGALERIPLSPKGEYYLTDLVGIAVAQGLPVQAHVLQDPQETIGINTRVHLAEAEAALRQRVNRAWMLAGVTLVDPTSTYIEPTVSLGQDTVIWPNTYLHGQTVVGEGCVLGPNTIIRDTRIGNHTRILSAVVERAIVEDGVDIGPFARLRTGAHLAEGVHMGNFGEVKNSYLGPGAKMGHFSYLGDATVGPDVNIGAGTITCNYDGKKKSPTEIGEKAFIGSDTMLVAPVKIGEGARTGAGAVVTKDVPPYTMVVGVPARAIRKLEKSD